MCTCALVESGMNIVSTIALGVFSSILAAVILYVIQRFYTWGYKKDFKSHLDSAKAATWQIENLCGFPRDYELVIGQVQELTQHVYGMYRSLYPLSLFPNRIWEKRLICTILYDIRCACSWARFTTVGYDGEAEWEARLEKLHKYFYKCGIFSRWNISTVHAQLDLLEFLINKNSLKDAFSKIWWAREKDDEFWEEMEGTFIEYNSFKEATSEIVPLSDIGRSGLFRREYREWLAEIRDGTPFERCWRVKFFFKSGWEKLIKKVKKGKK